MAADPRALTPVPEEPRKAETDGALVARARDGDHAAFEQIYRRYRNPVFATCLNHSLDTPRAEEVTQDTFLRAYQSLQRFDCSRALLPWLTSIAINRCIDVARKESRVTATEPDHHTFLSVSEGDTTTAEILRRGERSQLGKALKTLPWRQRRALVLFAVEGWTYSDIANAEGISVPSTKALLFRARQNLRRACERVPVGGVLAPVLLFRNAFRRARTELETRLNHFGPAALAEGAQALTAFGLAVSLSAGGLGGARPGVADLVQSASQESATADLLSAAPVSRPTEPAFTVPAARRRALGSALLDPTDGATPEDTRFTSVVSAPSGRPGAAVYATGSVPCHRATGCPILFASHDEGTTWRRLPAVGLTGTELTLPPAFPADRRIFAMGPEGLQVSIDQGSTFTTVEPLEGPVAFSPDFARDRRIVIGTLSPVEYRDDTGLIAPAPLLFTGSSRTSLAFVRGAGSSSDLLIGARAPTPSGTFRSFLRRCTASGCADLAPEIDWGEIPRFAPAESPSVAYAFSGDILARYDGRTRSATLLPVPADTARLTDVKEVGAMLIASKSAGAGRAWSALYVSHDEGVAWAPVRVAARLLPDGAARITVTPGERIIVAGTAGGLACSPDRGRTWQIRCP